MKMKTDAQSSFAQPGINSAIDIANITFELWERTAGSLTESELEWFAGAAEPALMAMQNLEDLIDGIGVSLSCEEASTGLKSGSFQKPSDVASLLFFASQSMRGIRAQLEVGNSANYRLRRSKLSTGE